ncbi:MAG TPA: DHHA1 domain-containing protein [Candidatus Acidoferrum sp.]|nr:DHHA1 domain-containing protein [Candidatus Acidoferrum sp.]
MTERLYYGDSFLRDFEARVTSCEREGERWRVTLDRTAFYPTSGGQPHDTGTLGGAAVVEVADTDDGKIVHYTTAEVPVGGVTGEIDWARRFDHMQQHTGQHLLSAVFLELFEFPTESFHLGREISTIDLQAPSIVPRHMEEAERRANEIVFEDRVVTVTYGTAQELAEAGIRKKVDREGVLRAVEIAGIDRQPCGGTHLSRTGQAGMVLLRKLERRRDAWRLEFVCGGRALTTARADYASLWHAATLLSCSTADVAGVIGKTLEERRATHGAAKRLEGRLGEYEAKSLLDTATTGANRVRIVAAAIEDATPSYLTLLAARLVMEAQVVALLGGRPGGHIVFAQTRGFSGDMGALAREIFKEFGGKGGGATDFAQGALADVSQLDAAIKSARDKASQRTPSNKMADKH